MSENNTGLMKLTRRALIERARLFESHNTKLIMENNRLLEKLGKLKIKSDCMGKHVDAACEGCTDGNRNCQIVESA